MISVFAPYAVGHGSRTGPTVIKLENILKDFATQFPLK